MASITHVPDNELIGFADRETEPKRTAAIEQHLEECDVCRDRLAAFRNAAETYRQFHEKVLKPGLAKPDVSWPRLRLDRAPRTKNQGLSRRSAVWWTSALAACLALAVLYLHKESPSTQMRTLLKRAENVTSGPHRRIELSIAGQRWYRPAVWRGGPIPAGLKHVEALFVNAHYGWEDPLSAHAFAAWRSRLRQKHDRMTSVHGADGMPRWYRLRTETNDGSLHIASLTLRADDLAAIHGAFEFADQEHVTIVDAGEIPESQPHSAAKNSLRTQAPEQAVGAADELRVFAALDRIGADVGEPLTIETDAAKQQVVVTGMGIRPEREREIRSALLAVPRTVARFLSGRARTGRHTGASAAESGAGYSADTNTAAHR
ncbi:MAG: hypothetical protein JOZ22_25475, partial [Acidobacteriia bacterium]|nr:hypothetical protein [Terriglobia bacterium]